jgi:hypothetical protein
MRSPFGSEQLKKGMASRQAKRIAHAYEMDLMHYNVAHLGSGQRHY